MHCSVATVYRKFVADDSPAFIGRLREEQLAEDIVESFKRQGTILFIIDEAGTMRCGGSGPSSTRRTRPRTGCTSS